MKKDRKHKENNENKSDKKENNIEKNEILTAEQKILHVIHANHQGYASHSIHYK